MNKDIIFNEKAQILTLLTLHAFMLEVLNTDTEYINYVQNLINQFSKAEKKIIKSSKIYSLRFTKKEIRNKQKTLLCTLYNIPENRFPYNYLTIPANGSQIPVYDRLIDDYEEGLEFNDSVDIMLLHLCNFLFYNEEKEQFDLEHLKLNEDSNLLKFYIKYKKPFYINYNIRNEWSKVIQCLHDIVISDKKCNKYLGKILYLNKFKRNKLDSSILNIVTILTKICMSRRNDIKKKYVDLFNKKFKIAKINNLLQIFFDSLVINKVNVECDIEELRSQDNIFYGILVLTRKLEKDDRLKTKMKFCLQPQKNYTEFISRDLVFIDDLQKISFDLNENKALNPLKCIVVKYANDLKNKTIKNYRMLNKSLCFYDDNLIEYLHYLFDRLDGTNLDFKIFKTVEMVVKTALVNKNDSFKKFSLFYIKIDDLINDLSSQEKFDIWIKLLYNFDSYESKNICKLWTEEIKKIDNFEECKFPIFQTIEKYQYVLKILEEKKVKKLIFLKNENCDMNVFLSNIKYYNFFIELDFRNTYFNYFELVSLWECISEKNIKSLQMSDCELTDSDVSLLASALFKKNNKLEILNIRFNDIKSKGAKYICDALKNENNKISFLDIGFNDLEVKGACYIFDALQHPNNQVSTLKINNTYINNKIGAIKIGEALSHKNNKLKYLDLSDNYFSANSLKIISQSFMSLNNKLNSLKMSGCSIFNDGLQYLCCAIRQENNKLTELDLSVNEFDLEGIVFIANTLKNTNNNLKSLILKHNNINERCSFFIAEALTNKNCKLDKLDLSYCSTNLKTFKEIFRVISEGKTSLRELKINLNNIETDSVDFVCQFIHNCGNLKVLDLTLSYELEDIYKLNIYYASKNNPNLTFLI